MKILMADLGGPRLLSSFERRFWELVLAPFGLCLLLFSLGAVLSFPWAWTRSRDVELLMFDLSVLFVLANAVVALLGLGLLLGGPRPVHPVTTLLLLVSVLVAVFGCLMIFREVFIVEGQVRSDERTPWWDIYVWEHLPAFIGLGMWGGALRITRRYWSWDESSGFWARWWREGS